MPIVIGHKTIFKKEYGFDAYIRLRKGFKSPAGIGYNHSNKGKHAWLPYAKTNGRTSIKKLFKK